MQITWLGHSAFCIKFEKSVLLFDPFITGNEKAKDLNLDEVISDVTHIALTHGHQDHIGDSLYIAKKKNIPIIANSDLAAWLSSQAIVQTIIGNIGGTLHFEDFSISFTQAIHSSAFLTEDNISVSLGNPNGFIVQSPSNPTIYHMGDTDIFGDMALINEFYKPEIGLVPVGGCFTMDGKKAALACQRYFDFKFAIACHYGTFDLLAQTAEEFEQAMSGAKTRLLLPRIGEELFI